MKPRSTGFGCFPLEDFSAGELFADSEGRIGIVCPQTALNGPHLEVLLDHGKRGRLRTWLSRYALVCALSEEHAYVLERRQKVKQGGRP